MKKKVIIFGPYPPPFGGVSIYVSILFNHMRDRGAKLWAYGGNVGSSRAISYIKHPGTEIASLLIKSGAGATFLDSSTFFIEYPHKVLITLWVALKKILSFYWIKIIHDGTLPARHRTFNFLGKFFFKVSIRSVNEFIVMNEDLRNWLQREIKVRQPISCINSLLPLPSANIEADLPKEIDQFIRRHDKIICSIGVFITNYGFKQIARAVDSIRKEKNLNIGLLFIDGAFTVDNQYKSEVLENRSWIAVAESLPHSNVLNILKKSDAFIRNVASESYGLSRVEALWCGTPVVATRVGETRGMLLFDYGNETELIAQIKEALFNPLIKKNIHFWAERFHNKAKENLQVLMSIADHKKESND